MLKGERLCLSSVSQFSRSVVSRTLRPQGLHHTSFPANHQLLELTQTHVHRVVDVIQPSYALSSPSSRTFILLSIRVFSSETVRHMRWPKYWSLSFSISPSNEYSGLISFRMDWFISLQSKELSRVFSTTTGQQHQFFGIQPSLWSNSYIHTYMITGKTIALTKHTLSAE